MFQLRNVVYRHQGAVILDGVDLTVSGGEKVALLGPSGAGKSTLLALLRRQQTTLSAWCPQDDGLVPSLSVFHNIYMGALQRFGTFANLRNLVCPASARRREVEEVAAALGIGEKLFTSVDRLSGGQARRTALGRALYSQRPVLLADEPVTGVDERQARAVLELALSRHQTAVVALHDRTLARDCFDRVIGIRQGRVVLDTSSAQLDDDRLAALYRPC